MQSSSNALNDHGSILIPDCVQKLPIDVEHAQKVNSRKDRRQVELTVVGGLWVETHPVEDCLRLKDKERYRSKEASHDNTCSIEVNPTLFEVTKAISLSQQSVEGAIHSPNKR